MTREISSLSFISLSQGVVFSGVPCDSGVGFGIVITAECDLAQKKIKSIHYITASKIKNFFCAHSCPNFLEGKIKSICNSNSLDYSSVIKNMDYVDYEKITKKDKCDQVFKELLDIYFNGCSEICVLRKNYEKDFCKKFNELFEHKLINYHYLKDFGKNHIDGYIVDFCVIRSFPLEFAVRMESGIENFIEDDEYAMYIFSNASCGLQKSDNHESESILSFFHKISSPELEHMMQRFSHKFIRIGLDEVEEKTKKSIFEQF